MEKFTKKPNFLTKYEVIISDYLKYSVLSYDGDISKYINNYFGWEDRYKENSYQGKAFRPALCIALCDSLSGDINAALPCSISVELVHNFSLIHDDIEDNDKLRRHKPTLWTIWGIPKALITGNSMLVLGNQKLEKLLEYGISKDKLFFSQKLLTESYLKMMEGQFLDISFEKKSRISESEYLKMIGLKTGALIECSVILGAISSNKDLNKSDLKLISDFGKDIGLLFQIRDDILGVWGTDKTGKPVGGDIRKKKKSLPIILTLNNHSVYDKEINEIMEKDSLEDYDVEIFLNIMDKIDIRDKCDDIAEKYLLKIQNTILNMPTSDEHKKTFNELTNFLMNRET
mgnify:CR=1 FL=1|tara:strand:+ start:59 stop:1090 length:1032 start_codon:yes stop_codon:yes gene_type:complete